MHETIMEMIKSHNYFPVWKNNKLTAIIGGVEVTFYEVENQAAIIALFWFNAEHNFGLYKLSKLACDVSEINNYIYVSKNSITLKYNDWFSNAFFGSVIKEDINEVHVDISIKKYSFSNSILKVNPELMSLIFEHAMDIHNKAKTYSNSVKTYMTNKSLGELEIKNVQKRTLVQKGELSFFIDRMNLDAKKKKKDFSEVLDNEDINNIQEMIRKFIYLGVFKKEFLEVLDDYFIRKRLDKILKTGNAILDLKITKLTTLNARKIKESNPNLQKAKILEELWQKFFEENLLHLLFSYQSLYPKIELNIKVDEKIYSKKPDFIGINHYGGVDIIEIKHHLTPALIYDKSHKNYVMSSDLSKAIMQATNYMDALIENKFTNENISNKIKRDLLSGNLNRPSAIIIISSTDNLIKKSSKSVKDKKLIQRDFTRIRNSLNNITILTFDEVLAIAERYKNNIIPFEVEENTNNDG